MFTYTKYPFTKSTCLCPDLFLKIFPVTFCLFTHNSNHVTRNNFGSNFVSTSDLKLVRQTIVQSLEKKWA